MAAGVSGHYGAGRTFSLTPVVWGTFRADERHRPLRSGGYVFRYPGGMGSPGRAICLIKIRTRCRLASGSDFFKQDACFLNRRGRCRPGASALGKARPIGLLPLRNGSQVSGRGGEPPAGPVPRLEAAVPDLKSRTIFVDHPCSYSENSLIIKRFKQHTESSPVLSACCSRRLLCQNLKYRNDEAS